MPYKTFTLTFAVLEDNTIKFLKKDEKDENGDPPNDGIDVYDGSVKIDGAIDNVIRTHFNVASTVASETNAVDDNVVNAENNNNNNAETSVADVVAENNDVATSDNNVVANNNGEANNNTQVNGANVGGSRKSHPKNVSFSKKYSKNKYNKKTLRNLERILSF